VAVFRSGEENAQYKTEIFCHDRKQGIHERIKRSGHRWLTPAILASQEAEMRSIAVQSQSRQIVHKTLS
jgi:hypothetical protein